MPTSKQTGKPVPRTSEDHGEPYLLSDLANPLTALALRATVLLKLVQGGSPNLLELDEHLRAMLEEIRRSHATFRQLVGEDGTNSGPDFSQNN
jgi:hypothetical protein